MPEDELHCNLADIARSSIPYFVLFCAPLCSFWSSCPCAFGVIFSNREKRIDKRDLLYVIRATIQIGVTKYVVRHIPRNSTASYLNASFRCCSPFPSSFSTRCKATPSVYDFNREQSTMTRTVLEVP